MSEGRNSGSAAVALRLAGASYPEIAEALGFTDERSARRAVERDLTERARDADPDKREILRAQSGARLERLLRSVWSKATTPTDPEHLMAVSKALSIIDRHTRLYGMDAPTEVLVHTPTTSEIDAWVTAVMRERHMNSVEEPDIIAIEAEIVDDERTA